MRTDPIRNASRLSQSYSRHRGTHPGDLSAFLHRAAHVESAQRHLFDLVTELPAEAAASGVTRADTASAELASYALHALSAAADLPDEPAVHRLVELVTAGLRPTA